MFHFCQSSSQSQPFFLDSLPYHLHIIQELNSQSFKCFPVTAMAKTTDKKVHLTIKYWETG